MPKPESAVRSALVTGANRGLGLAIAHGLSVRGFAVVLGARDRASAEQARATFPAGAQVELLVLDLARPERVSAALRELGERKLHIDVLVNNAGILPVGDVLSTPDEVMREAMEVHFFGPLALARGLVPAMQARGFGRVVNVSSNWGSFASGLEGPAAYSISKATLNALTLKLSREVGSHVLVNTMCPGWLRTRMGGDEAELSPEQGADTALWLATLPDGGPSGGFFRERTSHPW
jgi:NAD(P)-dependent dehydrogenase (short-subunit alcohol dehydrogenase family)